MNARTAHVVKPALLFVLLIVGLVLLFSRPAAQTSNDLAIDLLLRDAKIVSDLLGNPAFVVADEAVDGDALIRFYNLRNSRLAWSGTPRTLADAAFAKSALLRAHEHGLDESRYHLGKLSAAAARSSIEEAAIHDLLLTDAILKYARELRIGNRYAADRNTDLPVPEFDVVSSLNSALEGGTLAEFLADLAPPHPEYKRLFTALGHYRRLASEGGWPQILSSAAPDHLRRRLELEDTGFLTDIDTVEALRRYQRQNGLEPDGRLGPRTLEALNTPASERVDQIASNMERWRWLPHRLESRRVMVNVADASLEVIDNDQVILRSKVIVGAANNQTPIFRAVATAVTVNPPWNVPSSIAINEFLPRLRNNPNFLVSQNIVLLDGPPDDPHGTRIDWKRVPPKTFPYRLQQRPGPGNALGQLKLEMPNAFSVYLHDTPGKREFARPERNLSHGCVRVEQVLPLASIALSGDAMGAAEKLAGAVASGETQYLALERPLPVYVLYWTAIGKEDGTAQFRRDVYQRDRRLLRALRVASTPFFTGDCQISEG